MFPWYLILAKGLSQSTFHTEKGSAVKAVVCENCNYYYAYRLSREAVGDSTGFLVPDYETAQQRASDKLRELLERGCDPVPCPECGWYQQNMVTRARQLKYRPLLIIGVVLIIIVMVLSFPVIICTFNEGPKGPTLRSGIGYFVLLLIWEVALATSAGCLAARFLLPCFFNPNKADVESRIQLGRSRAIY
jgi:hypothetical protein